MIKIDTALEVSVAMLDGVSNLETKVRILGKYANMLCKILRKVEVPVYLSTDPKKKGIWINQDSLFIHKTFIERNAEWQVERASAALYGAVARAVAKGSRAREIGWIGEQIDTFIEGEVEEKESDDPTLSVPVLVPVGVKLNKINPEVRSQIRDHMAPLMYTIQNIGTLLKNLEGVGGAVAASFLSGINIEESYQRLQSTCDDERWAGAYPAIVTETLIPGTIPDEFYPTEKIKDAIRHTAREMIDLHTRSVDRLEKKDIEGVMKKLHEIFEENPEENDPGTDGSMSEDPELEEEMEANSQDQAEMTVDRMNQTIPSVGILQPRPPKVVTYDLWKGLKPISKSPFVDDFKEWLMDERMEQTPGHVAGRVGPQTHRLFTDQRVMVRRSKVIDPPDAAVAVMVDQSGSMGLNVRGGRGGTQRIEVAAEIHDAIIAALHEIEVPYVSALYTPGYDDVTVYVTNPGGRPEPLSIKGQPALYDNADYEALIWAGQQLDRLAAKTSVIVFLADGHFTTVTPATIREYCKKHNLTVVHVDFEGHEASPFGQYLVNAKGKTVREVGQPIARILATALEL
jgi:hypothetical protein